MRIIDADLLECDTEWDDYEDGFTAYSRTQIECAPSIDIVRCEECKYGSDNKVYGCSLINFNTDEWHRMYADDFCSRGERKEGESVTQTETQNSNLTFEKRTMLDCYNCKRFDTEDECIECLYEPKDEPQTERSE